VMLPCMLSGIIIHRRSWSRELTKTSISIL